MDNFAMIFYIAITILVLSFGYLAEERISKLEDKINKIIKPLK